MSKHTLICGGRQHASIQPHINVDNPPLPFLFLHSSLAYAGGGKTLISTYKYAGYMTSLIVLAILLLIYLYLYIKKIRFLVRTYLPG
jgi:hypothetical protein